MKKKARSPQEKKSLSYAKDRRNGYGENNKSSRKNIPKSKALAKRRQRHEQDQALRSARVANSEDQLVAAEVKARTAKPRTWLKHPDITLADHLSRKRRGA